MKYAVMRLGQVGVGLLLAWGCSSESSNSTPASGGTGATGGAAGAGGATTGGATSGGGTSSGGATSGGGTAGTSTGGAAGSGGAGGDASVDAPTDAPTDVTIEASAPVVGFAGSVWCGATVPKCSVTSGGKCCYSKTVDAGANYVCQGSTGVCSTTTLKCDSSNDCTTGQVCCLTSTLLGPSTSVCKLAAECKNGSLVDGGIPASFATQLCDPTKVAPTECVYPSGSSCKPTNVAGLPGTYFSCKQ